MREVVCVCVCECVISASHPPVVLSLNIQMSCAELKQQSSTAACWDWNWDDWRASLIRQGRWERYSSGQVDAKSRGAKVSHRVPYVFSTRTHDYSSQTGETCSVAGLGWRGSCSHAPSVFERSCATLNLTASLWYSMTSCLEAVRHCDKGGSFSRLREELELKDRRQHEHHKPSERNEPAAPDHLTGTLRRSAQDRQGLLPAL